MFEFLFPNRKTDRQIVIEHISKTDDEMAAYYNVWNQTTDDTIIDICIYKIKSLQLYRTYLSKQLR